jgi:hypothetical protein
MQIVRKGLRDRDARVHEAAVQLLSSWYATCCEEDLELLLDTLQSTTHLGGPHRRMCGTSARHDRPAIALLLSCRLHALCRWKEHSDLEVVCHPTPLIGGQLVISLGDSRVITRLTRPSQVCPTKQAARCWLRLQSREWCWQQDGWGCIALAQRM